VSEPARLWPSFVTYATSFLLIGVDQPPRHVPAHQPRRAWLLLLMDVAFLPFPTGVLAENLRPEDLRTASLLYAARNHRLLDEGVTEAAARQVGRGFALGPVMYAGATLLALISPIAGLIMFALLLVLYAVEGQRGGNPPGASPARSDGPA
jgi:hypothetical protein